MLSFTPTISTSRNPRPHGLHAWVLLLLLVPWLSLACATGRGAAPPEPAEAEPVASESASSGVAARAVTAPLAPFEGWEWPDDPRLRSAGLRRDRALLDGPGHAPEVEVAALRAHFAAVDAWLDARTDASLALALDRLAAERGRAFAPTERARVRAELAAEREQQRAVLRAYAEEGRFPLNPDVGGSSTPIFVDAHDTACAVGHLMRVSGAGEAVAKIARLDNDVFVPDAAQSPVADWALTSGLTLEEAAVVQPSYTPPSGDPLAPLAAPGGFLEVDGLRIDNFEMRVDGFASVFAGTPGFEEACLTIPNYCAPQFQVEFPTLVPDPAAIELLVQEGEISVPGHGETMGSEGVHTLFMNASGAGGFPNLSQQPAPFNLPALRTSIVFDVSAVEAGYGIERVGTLINGYFWTDVWTYGPDAFVSTLVTDGDEVLGAVEIGDDPADFLFDQEYLAAGGAIEFEARDRVTVRIAGYLGPDGVWNGFQQSFRLVPVPEPTTALSFGLGLVTLGVWRRRRR